MKIIFLVVIIIFTANPQAEYVRIDNPVYDFLERINNIIPIENYSQFELPKTRTDISNYLKQIIINSNKLDYVDKKLLEDFKSEFEFELFGTLNKASSLINSDNYDLFSQNEKYLYKFLDSSKFVMFVNLIAEGDLILARPEKVNELITANLFTAGGEIRGTVLNKVGFYLRGTNGVFHGNRLAAQSKKELMYNFKFNEKPDENFFDETEGYVTADFDFVKLKIARDRINLGYGTNKFLIDNNAPLFDYFSFKIQFGFFNFSYLHGKLLGEKTQLNDSLFGIMNQVTEKYFVYHRMGFDFSKHLKLGVGEAVIYGDRPMDISYLIPISFFKSVEHYNQDRDNTMLFFDLNNQSLPNTNIFLNFLIDDIAFGKIGTGWWGNQTVTNCGILSSPFYPNLPLDLRFEYYRIEPYAFTHRLLRNNFTNLGFSLSSIEQPNSELFFGGISFRFTNRLAFSTNFSYSRHGSNIVRSDGTIQNFGGDINLGRRTFDSEKVKFLDGNLEIQKKIVASIYYEPINQYKFFLDAALTNSNKTDNSDFNLSFRLNLLF